jgi:hypothetical protein
MVECGIQAAKPERENNRLKKPRIAALSALLLAILSFGLSAQETGKAPSVEPSPSLESKPIQAIRTLGSQTFEIDLGLMVPLFSSDAAGTINPGGNLGLGGAGHIKWGAFVSQYLSFGVDLGGSLVTGPNSFTNGTSFGLVNIGPHVTANFRLGNFQVPVFLSPAFSIMTYSTTTYLGFAVRPGVGLYYDVTPDWSFGLNLQYWWVPELYAGPTPPVSQNRFGNFLEISVSALYSF